MSVSVSGCWVLSGRERRRDGGASRHSTVCVRESERGEEREGGEERRLSLCA